MRTAHLASVGSHAIDGVAKLHTGIRPRSVLRDGMLTVPQAKASRACIPVNALGYAGRVFLRDRNRLDTLRRLGP